MNNNDLFTPANEFKYYKYGTTKYPNIIRFFDKTPQTIVCPHFFELNWGYGCRFDCAYCYLKGTLRGNTDPRYLPLKHILPCLKEAFKEISKPSIFNSGELTDSLNFPKVMERIVDEFETQDKHKLLLLTKSANVDFLLKKLRRQTIASFSINAPKVSDRWEKKTAPPIYRIESGKKLSDIGYTVRVRIDPIFPIENWKEEYGELVDLLLSKFTPERITLGTPRGLAKTLMFAKDLSWTKWFTEKTGWGKKLSTPLRKEIYLFFFDKLRESGFKNPVAICKETIDMWKILGKNPGRFPYWEDVKCNCVW